MITQTIIRDITPLERKRWEFAMMDLASYYSKPCLVCNTYAIETRATARHKWRASEKYDRLKKRDSTLILDIPVDVGMEVREKLLGQFMHLVDTLEIQ